MKNHDGSPTTGSEASTQAQADRVITVIVPHYNDPRLATCLEALDGLDAPPGSTVEIVVVDNGSHVPPRGLVESRANATFLVEGRRGSYAARNTGLAAARGELIAFTDSDCRPAKDWLVTAVRRLDEDPDLAAVAGRIETFFDAGRPDSPAAWWAVLHAFPQESYVGAGWGATANLVVRRQDGESVGWFDAEAQSGGDRDFGRRLTGSGRPLAYEPAAVVAHPARATLREMFTKGRRTAKGHARMEALEGTGVRDFVRALRAFARELVQVVKRGVGHPELPDTSARVQYIAVGLVYRTFWFAEKYRWRVQYGRELGRGTRASR